MRIVVEGLPTKLDPSVFDEIDNVTTKGTEYSNFAHHGTQTSCPNLVNRPRGAHEVTIPESISRRYCYDANGNLIAATNAKYSELTLYGTLIPLQEQHAYW